MRKATHIIGILVFLAAGVVLGYLTTVGSDAPTVATAGDSPEASERASSGGEDSTAVRASDESASGSAGDRDRGSDEREESAASEGPAETEIVVMDRGQTGESGGDETNSSSRETDSPENEKPTVNSAVIESLEETEPRSLEGIEAGTLEAMEPDIAQIPLPRAEGLPDRARSGEGETGEQSAK